MRRILTMFLAFYWMAAFVMLAVTCGIDPDSGFSDAFHLLGFSGPVPGLAGPDGVLLTIACGFAFAFTASLFLWALVAEIVSRDSLETPADEVMRVALAFAGSVMLAVAVSAAYMRGHGLFPVMAAHLTALLATYLAMHVERIGFQAGDRRRATDARLMASNAARSYAIGEPANDRYRLTSGVR